jgi:hypothetical protein
MIKVLNRILSICDGHEILARKSGHLTGGICLLCGSPTWLQSVSNRQRDSALLSHVSLRSRAASSESRLPPLARTNKRHVLRSLIDVGLSCDTVWTGKQIPTFWRSMLPEWISVLKMEAACSSVGINLQVVTTQTNIRHLHLSQNLTSRHFITPRSHIHDLFTAHFNIILRH